MTVPEADTATATVTALTDQGIPAPTLAPISLEADNFSSLPLPPVWPSVIWPSTWPSTKIGSSTEHTQDDVTDDGQGKSDGCLARTNTVTTCGKAKEVSESLDVAACFSRLQTELKKDEELEAEAEGLARQEVEENGEERVKTIDRMWAEREMRVRAAEQTASIDERLQDFLHHPEIMGSVVEVVPGTLDLGEFRTRPGPGDELSLAIGAGDELSIEPIPERACGPATLPLFKWGTGPVPGEEKYSSKKSKGASGCCIVS